MFHDWMLISLSNLIAVTVSVIQLTTSVYNALVHTPHRPRFKVLKGLIPMVLAVSMFWWIFHFTDWAWSHAGYVTIMMIPVFSLINSRQIVCNVADMDMDCFPKSTLWYLLFPINRLLPQYVQVPTNAIGLNGTPLIFQEGHVALFVFAVTLFWYLHFACGTVIQICTYLDIHCFAIKPK